MTNKVESNSKQELLLLVKNNYFGQKGKCWSKIKISVKNKNVGQKYKFRQI